MNEAISQLLYQIEGLRDAVDMQAALLDVPIFGNSSDARLLTFTDCEELQFARAISWIYALYFDIGRVGVDFFSQKFGGFNQNEPFNVLISPEYQGDRGIPVSHPEVVRRMDHYLRTNIRFKLQTDVLIARTCHSSFVKWCNNDMPKTNADWQTCTIGFLQDVVDFFGALIECINKIKTDADRDIYLNEWRVRRNQFISPEKFDSICQSVASNLGRSIDVRVFRERYYTLALEHMRVSVRDESFDVTAEKWIESTLLRTTISILPISSKDIMNRFNISGPRVADLLEQVSLYYRSGITDRDQLFLKLDQYSMDGSMSTANSPVYGDLIFASNGGIINMSKKQPKQPVPGLWSSGLLYLVAIIVIATIIAVFANFFGILSVPIAVIAIAVMYILYGALQLRTRHDLSELNFMDLVRISLRQIPKLQSNKLETKSNDDEAKKL